MNSEHKLGYDEKSENINPDIRRNDADDEEGEEEKAIPPLYVCIHRNDPRCNNMHPHPSNPTVYDNVTQDTPCRHCGHTGTLRKVN